jgi:hypothetical protein
VLRIAEMLEPSWHALYALQMDQDILEADESRWRLMDGAKAKPQIIGTASEQAIWYGFEMNKTAETVDAVLADFEGWLIVDGLSVYPAVHQRRHDGYINGTRDGPPFRMANCWVHARRYYCEVGFSSRSITGLNPPAIYGTWSRATTSCSQIESGSRIGYADSSTVMACEPTPRSDTPRIRKRVRGCSTGCPAGAFSSEGGDCTPSLMFTMNWSTKPAGA